MTEAAPIVAGRRSASRKRRGRVRRPRILPPAWRRRWWITAAVVLLAAAAALDRLGLLGRQGTDHERYHNGVFTVARVVDGDTIDIDVPDGEHTRTRVRLWGVDAPEPWRSGRAAMYFAEQASEFARQTVGGRQVRIELSPHRTRGRYGRLLAYVYLVETGQMLNEMLLETGHAYADRRFDHVRKARFAELELRAQRAKRGLWTDVRPGQFPAWKQRIEAYTPPGSRPISAR